MSKTARALRRRSTEAEKLLWSRLRGRRLEGIKFKRQVPIANYIVDFVALDLKFIVEVDGGQHGSGPRRTPNGHTFCGNGAITSFVVEQRRSRQY